MPITIQGGGTVGGGGGLTELTIKTSSPNTTVIITKENYSNTLVSDDTCLVTCKLTNGTYQITVQSSDGKTAQKEIVINNQEEADLRITDQIKNLALGAKLKFSSGKKFYLKAKNVSGHTSNSVTLVSEFIIENIESEGSLYTSNGIVFNTLSKYYNELSKLEKEYVINRSYSCHILDYDYNAGQWNDTFQTKQSRFWLMSNSEMGGTGTNSGAKLGFKDDASRIKKHKNGNAGTYWLRDCDDSPWDNDQSIVKADGKFSSLRIMLDNNNNHQSAGMVPACDVKGDTKVLLDTDGYWVIVG